MIIETQSPVRSKRRSPRPDWPRRRWVGVLAWGYLLLAVGIWLAMRECGDRSWPGALLLLAPRWPYACPLVLLWPLVLWNRRWRAVAVLLAGSAVIAFPVMGFRVSWPSGSERSDLRLVTCNIHRQHLDPARLRAFLDEVKPDVVALQGWADMHRESLFDDTWNILRSGELLLASRFPVKERAVLDLKRDARVSMGEQGAAALYEIDLRGGPVSFINLHLASPHAGLNSMWQDKGTRLAENLERRWEEAELVRRLGDQAPGTLLLSGDFNTTSESPIFREMWDGFADAFLTRGTGLGLTYFNNHTQIRIDHILGDSSCEFVRCWVGPDVNAAHRPVVADVKLR